MTTSLPSWSLTWRHASRTSSTLIAMFAMPLGVVGGAREAQLVGNLSIRVDQRHIDQVLPDEPDLHLVRADHVADQHIIGAIIARLSRLPGHGPRLLEHDLVRM